MTVMKQILYFNILLLVTQTAVIAAPDDPVDPNAFSTFTEETQAEAESPSETTAENSTETPPTDTAEENENNESTNSTTEPNPEPAVDTTQFVDPSTAAYMDYTPPSNQYFLTIRRNQGPSLISSKSYTTLQSFSFPFTVGNIHPFIDLRFHQFDRTSEFATNLGLGLRVESASSLIFGVNAYYDYRKAHKSDYSQVGLGFEVIGGLWNLRLNGYQPVGKKNRLVSYCLYDCYTDGYFFLQETYATAMKGANFEIERVLKDFSWGDIRLGLGTYYYHRNKGCRKNICGPEIRLTSNITDYITVSVLATYDKVYNTRIQAQIGLTLPFYVQSSDTGRFHLGNSNRRLYQPVYRNDAMLVKTRNSWTWNY
jgi:hypothetical protein